MDNLKEFEAEFYSEADELLENIKNILAHAESISNDDLKNLLRYFHTLKGISAMMGFNLVESISHKAESLLKFLFENKLTPKPNGLKLLFEAAKLIEANLTAKGQATQNQLDSINDIINDIEKLKEIIEQQNKSETEIISTAEELLLPHDYKISFIATVELKEKNITVSTVREKLEEIGKIISATPIVTPDKLVEFVFRVKSKYPLEQLKAMLFPELKVEIIGQGETLEQTQSSKSSENSGSPNSKISKLTSLGAGIIRVDLSKVDELISQMGEIVISRTQIDDALKQLLKSNPEINISNLLEANQKLERQLRMLRGSIMRIRMVPISNLFDRMQFVVQDAAQTLSKKVRLITEGGETEIDKMLVEKITDSILHLVRNAAAHGIELPSKRLELGKEEVGIIGLTARNINDKIVVEVWDDGQGVDSTKLKELGNKKGIITKDNNISNDLLLRIMTTPGLSTRDNADKIGGRGVGMDVVKKTIDEVGGKLELNYEEGKGTRFTLTLPLTLSIIDAIIVKQNNEIYAIPQSHAIEVIFIDKDTIRTHNGMKFLSYREGAIKAYYLSELVGLNGITSIIDNAYGIILKMPAENVALLVEKVLGIKEIVVRGMEEIFVKNAGFSGVAELGDGKPILIIDTEYLLNNKK